ncbi:PIN domain-containing protein [Sphingorhabdus profundilacus]|nr:PIN domain-containing protein [Sphingorhabdus profundilacus]
MLDTNIVVHMRERNENILTRFSELSVQPHISVLTRVELESGVYSHPEWTDSRREAVDELLAMLPTLNFMSSMADAYGEILRQTGFSRRKIIDRMIAATALVADLTLITNNGDDFEDIDGLKLEIWKP